MSDRLTRNLRDMRDSIDDAQSALSNIEDSLSSFENILDSPTRDSKNLVFIVSKYIRHEDHCARKDENPSVPTTCTCGTMRRLEDELKTFGFGRF